MALSNWDTFAIGPDGKTCPNGMLAIDGRYVELYKNWLYVGDHNLEKYKHFVPGKGGENGLVPPFTGGCLAQIWEGNVQMCKFDIRAKRGPQDSIMLLAIYTDYQDKKTVRKFLSGIAGCGYDDVTGRIMKAAGKKRIPRGYELYSVGHGYEPGKVKTVSLDLISKEKIEKDNNGKLQQKVKFGWIKIPFKKGLDSKWIGLQPETINLFYEWLATLVKEIDEEELTKWFNSIETKKLKRVNQGDQFFSDRIGLKDNNSTKPGKCKKPIIEKMLEK